MTNSVMDEEALNIATFAYSFDCNCW